MKLLYGTLSSNISWIYYNYMRSYFSHSHSKMYLTLIVTFITTSNYSFTSDLTPRHHNFVPELWIFIIFAHQICKIFFCFYYWKLRFRRIVTLLRIHWTKSPFRITDPTHFSLCNILRRIRSMTMSSSSRKKYWSQPSI